MVLDSSGSLWIGLDPFTAAGGGCIGVEKLLSFGQFWSVAGWVSFFCAEKPNAKSPRRFSVFFS